MAAAAGGQTRRLVVFRPPRRTPWQYNSLLDDPIPPYFFSRYPPLRAKGSDPLRREPELCGCLGDGQNFHCAYISHLRASAASARRILRYSAAVIRVRCVVISASS